MDRFIRNFNVARAAALKGEELTKFLNNRGEEIRVPFIDPYHRVFADWISRMPENKGNGWALSAKDKLTKDWLAEFAPVFLVLMEHDGTPKYVVSYDEGILEKRSYPEDFWLINIEEMLSN